MMYSTPARWVGSLCVFLCVVMCGSTATAQEPAVDLSKELRKKLAAQFPGWTPAPAPACAASANVVQADIDFDQQDDTALLVQLPSGATHVVVALPRVINDAVLHDLGPVSAFAGATHLAVLPTGHPVRGPGAMFDDYLSGPTFAVASCDAPLVALVWTGYGFRPVPVTTR